MAKKILSVLLTITATVFLSGLAVAHGLEVFRGTPEEIQQVLGVNQSQSSDQSLGAIVMHEGQREIITSLLPDNNNEDDLGAYGQAYNNIYASSTVHFGGAVSTATSTFADNLVVTGNIMTQGVDVCRSDGTDCAGIDSAGIWVNATTYYYVSSSTAFTSGIGDTTPDAFFDVDGMADVVQLLAEGHSAQNQYIFKVQNSAEAGKFGVDSSGNVHASGTLTFAGTTTSTISGYLNVSGSSASTSTFTGNLASSAVVFATTGIGSAGTLYAGGAANIAGAVTLDGAVTLGNATSDDITLTGRWATDMDSKTANTYDLGSYTLPWKNLYASSTVFADALIVGSTSATSTFNGEVSVSSSVRVAGNVFPEANNTRNLGAYDFAFANVHSSGTAYLAALNANGNVDLGDATTDTITPTGRFDADIDPSTNNTRDLGLFGFAFNDVFASGTAHSNILNVAGGSTVTSTLNTNVIVNEGTSATSTLHLGGTGTSGSGACIILANGSGSGNLYIFYDGHGITTSTNASDCY